MKNNNTIFWIIGIIVLLVVVANYLPKQEEGMIGLTPHYLDKYGNEIFPSRGFTIVDGTLDVHEIYFDISAVNKDVPIKNIQLVSAYPPVFEDALVGVTPQSLTSGETKKLWTSEPMLTEQFEAISPVNFWIELSGIETYTDTTIYPDRANSGDISFVAKEPGSTQSFFDGLFSIINIGGQNYHHESARKSFRGADNTLISYSGSGYFTGMSASVDNTGSLSILSCKIIVDGTEIPLPFFTLDNQHEAHYHNIHRFESSLKFQCSWSTLADAYVTYYFDYMTD